MLNRKFVSRSDGLKTLTDPLTPGKLKKTSGPLLLGICFRTFISFFEWLGWKKKVKFVRVRNTFKMEYMQHRKQRGNSGQGARRRKMEFRHYMAPSCQMSHNKMSQCRIIARHRERLGIVYGSIWAVNRCKDEVVVRECFLPCKTTHRTVSQTLSISFLSQFYY